MKYTNTMKINGELATRQMSKYAKKFYGGADRLDIYEYDNDGKRYSFCFAGEWTEGLTFGELEDAFEEMQLACDMEAIANYMDDEIREELHFHLAPCAESTFIAEYVKRDPAFSDLLADEFDYVLR